LMFGKPPPMVRTSLSRSLRKVKTDPCTGLYEQQDENQCDHNLRGKFLTDKDGNYSFYCLKPTPYPIPFDGPAGKLLQLLDRHPYRPAHIHLIVSSIIILFPHLGLTFLGSCLMVTNP
jgi:hypothetical protein